MDRPSQPLEHVLSEAVPVPCHGRPVVGGTVNPGDPATAKGILSATSANFSGGGILAIQVAGTPSTTQVPFFIASCDYTIIGDEFYAASAYLTREPVLLGSLIGQDWGKVMMLAIIVAGILAVSFYPPAAAVVQKLLPG